MWGSLRPSKPWRIPPALRRPRAPERSAARTDLRRSLVSDRAGSCGAAGRLPAWIQLSMNNRSSLSEDFLSAAPEGQRVFTYAGGPASMTGGPPREASPPPRKASPLPEGEPFASQGEPPPRKASPPPRKANRSPRKASLPPCGLSARLAGRELRLGRRTVRLSKRRVRLPGRGARLARRIVRHGLAKARGRISAGCPPIDAGAASRVNNLVLRDEVGSLTTEQAGRRPVGRSSQPIGLRSPKPGGGLLRCPGCRMAGGMRQGLL